MRTFKLNSSLKDIPVASEAEIKEKLTEQVGKLMRRMRLKARFYLKKNDKDECNDFKTETYGFKSTYTPKVNKHLLAFENDLMELVRNVKFRRVHNKFQSELRKDVQRIRNSTNVIVAADKTANFYEMSKEEYSKLLESNVTAGYKKADYEVVEAINNEALKVTKHLAISDRISQLPLKEAFITLKDHKENFESAPKCRLLNPTKSYVGKISKVLLDGINQEIRKQTGLNQWTNTDQMLKWFMTLEKGKFNLLKFDVVEFYPSITESLLNNAIKFAEKYVNIAAEDISIIQNSCKSVLHSKGATWVKNKKNHKNSIFDVAMGSYSGAETCELIGLYMLHGLKKVFGDGLVGLYRDDGLAAIPIQSGYKTEKLKAAMHRFAKGLGLRITIEAPLTTTDFLDVKLDINSHTFSPFHKPNSNLLYVNVNSNHPKNIIKCIPKIVNDRLTKRSSSKKEFEENKSDYERALKEAGYDSKLEYAKTKPASAKNKRKRKVTWFNPPFCLSIRTNIAREFIDLVKRHFTKRSPLRPIFNKNNIRVSYCCMKNMGALIKQHNANILKDDREDTELGCNCQDKDSCPFKGQGISCQAKCLVYKAEVTTATASRFYIGLAEKEFKWRYRNHTSSFNLDRKFERPPTSLAGHVRDLKRRNVPFTIKWSVVRRARPIKDGGAACRVCLLEAVEIAFADEGCMNNRNEVVHVCPHKKKFLLEYSPRNNAPG